jgi:hypothetical protein
VIPENDETRGDPSRPRGHETARTYIPASPSSAAGARVHRARPRVLRAKLSAASTCAAGGLSGGDTSARTMWD